MAFMNLEEHKNSFHRAVKYLSVAMDNKSGFQFDSAGATRRAFHPYKFPEEIFLNIVALDVLRDVLSEAQVAALMKHVESERSRRFSTLNYFKDDTILPDDTKST